MPDERAPDSQREPAPLSYATPIVATSRSTTEVIFAAVALAVGVAFVLLAAVTLLVGFPAAIRSSSSEGMMPTLILFASAVCGGGGLALIVRSFHLIRRGEPMNAVYPDLADRTGVSSFFQMSVLVVALITCVVGATAITVGVSQLARTRELFGLNGLVASLGLLLGGVAAMFAGAICLRHARCPCVLKPKRSTSM
jgi:hypothetical protein